MKESLKVDLAVVGGGIVGIAHAYLAARAGLSVAVFERSPQAQGASVRNFGMVRPVGLPPGPLHSMGLRSRHLWLELLAESGLYYHNTGSLYAAYRSDEAAVAQEFSQMGPSLGYDCAWLSAEETLTRTQALRADGLLGALWSSSELTVDPRQVLREIPNFLAARYRVEFHFNTAVQAVESNCLHAANLRCQTNFIMVAPGDDFQTLFPDYFGNSGVTRCKLQMMRTVLQPAGWRLGPMLAFGLSFLHYPAFRTCQSLPALRERVERESPDLVRYGIHVMVSETARGELTIGDSHEYGLAVNVFDNPAINRLILDFARAHLSVPSLEIAEVWHGVYAKHPEAPWLSFSPVDGVRVATVTSGIGMTIALAFAEQNLKEMGAIQ